MQALPTLPPSNSCSFELEFRGGVVRRRRGGSEGSQMPALGINIDGEVEKIWKDRGFGANDGIESYLYRK